MNENTQVDRDASLSGDILAKLKKECERSSQKNLPSLGILAARYGVSAPTVRKAALQLRKEGVLRFGRGSRILIVNHLAQAAFEKRPCAAEAFAAYMKKEMASGRIRLHAEFPKTAVLTAMHHISTATINRAMQLLQKENLVHKKGRRWFSGPAACATSGKRMAHPPVICVLQESDESWSRFERTPLSRCFFDAFNEQVERYGIRLLSYSVNQSDIEGNSNTSIQRRIRRLDNRYMGTLVIWGAGGYDTLCSYAVRILRLRRPVAWVDFQDAHPALSLQSSLFARCYCSEKRAAEVVVRTLYESGHRSIVYALTEAGSGSWQRIRGECIAHEAEKKGVSLRLIEMPPDDSIANKMKAPLDQHLLRTVSYLPTLKAVASCRDATAVIAPHDYTAFHLYRLFRIAGVNVPKNMSLISFDNSLRIQSLGITSIDRGFGSLGALAFNFISRYMPIQRDADGDIAGRPHAVDRGSVDSPRKGALPLDLASVHKLLQD